MSARCFALCLALLTVVFAGMGAHASSQEGSAQKTDAPAATGEVSRRAEETAQASPEHDGAKKDEAEGDEDAQFKYSASVQKIGHALGLSPQTTYWLSVAINFGILFVAIAIFAAKTMPRMFRERSGGIQKGIDEAAKASAESKARLQAIEDRLAKLDGEIGAMRSQAEQEGRAEEARVAAATEEEKRKIIEAAEQEIKAAAVVARRELRQHAAELAVGLAQRKISVDAETDRALVHNFVSHLTDGQQDKTRGGNS